MTTALPNPISPSERIYRTAFLVILTLFAFLCVHLVRLRASLTTSSSPTATAKPPRLASRARMLQITARNDDFHYFPNADVLLIILAKGGSTSMFNWLYYGFAGEKFNKSQCETFAQNTDSPCWENHATKLYKMSEDDQWRILTGDATLRVAIQRNPFARLLSSWKSKITCDEGVYGTDVGNRDILVPKLLKQAGLKNDDRKCLSISELADTLDLVRRRVGTSETELKSLQKLDVHLRPQEFFFEEINYHMVLDVSELANVSSVKPILQRLPKKDLRYVRSGPPRMNRSKGKELLIPEKAAKLLHLFAMESKWAS